MTLVMYCPKHGGQQHRAFKSLRRAKDFLKEACRRDFGNFAYLAVFKHGVTTKLEQYHNGVLNYCASGKHVSKRAGV